MTRCENYYGAKSSGCIGMPANCNNDATGYTCCKAGWWRGSSSNYFCDQQCDYSGMHCNDVKYNMTRCENYYGAKSSGCIGMPANCNNDATGYTCCKAGWWRGSSSNYFCDQQCDYTGMHCNDVKYNMTRCENYYGAQASGCIGMPANCDTTYTCCEAGWWGGGSSNHYCNKRCDYTNMHCAGRTDVCDNYYGAQSAGCICPASGECCLPGWKGKNCNEPNTTAAIDIV